MDPGYHIAKPITVMQDGLAPHSPPYISTFGNTVKTNSYEFYEHNSAYVVWNLTKAKGSSDVEEQESIIHVAHPFLSGYDIAERRNLVFNMKTLVNRTREGELASGMYFFLGPIETAKLTIFWKGSDENKLNQVKIPFLHFLSEQETSTKSISDRQNVKKRRPANGFDGNGSRLVCWSTSEVRTSPGKEDEELSWPEAIARVAADSSRDGELLGVLRRIASILANKHILAQIASVNAPILQWSLDN